MKTLLITLGLLVVLTISITAKEKESEKKIETSAAVAVTTLTGVVIDKVTGEPLTGVEVCIDGTGQKAYTDFDGNYKFDNLTPGDYSVSVSLISYTNNKKSVKLRSATQNTVKLELETLKQ
jgi:uncharacterized membrane protein